MIRPRKISLLRERLELEIKNPRLKVDVGMVDLTVVYQFFQDNVIAQVMPDVYLSAQNVA